MSLSDEERGIIKRTFEAREFAKLDHQQMAEALGCSRPTYTRYENDRVLTRWRIQKFCEVTGVRERWLLKGEGPMKAGEEVQLTDKERKIIEAYRQQTAKRQQIFEDLIMGEDEK